MLQQNYSNYTNEDHQVWGILFKRQMENLSKLASEAYLEGIEKIEFKSKFIPDFTETNKILNLLTGWSLRVVPGIIPVREFFVLLNERKFCATTWLRKMSQLDYLEEPDMFHDVFGHVPLLTNPVFCDFFHGLSRIALKFINNENALEMLGRMYWFTVEFGLIKEKGDLKIYGAGLLSSPGESKFCLSNVPLRIPYNVRDILSTAYINDKFQEKYFVIDSYELLFNSLDEIESVLIDELKNEKITKILRI